MPFHISLKNFSSHSASRPTMWRARVLAMVRWRPSTACSSPYWYLGLKTCQDGVVNQLGSQPSCWSFLRSLLRYSYLVSELIGQLPAEGQPVFGPVASVLELGG